MATINIDYRGFIQVDYNDLKIQKIGEEGHLINVDITTITPEEAIEGIKRGDYFIQFIENLKVALDGEDELEASIEEEQD